MRAEQDEVKRKTQEHEVGEREVRDLVSLTRRTIDRFKNRDRREPKKEYA